MKHIKSFKVIPSLPEGLDDLKTLAYNFYWSWDPEIQHLFRRLDRHLWETVEHNPVKLLNSIEQTRLDFRSKDEGYLSHLSRSRESLDKYLSQSTWFEKSSSASSPFVIAYFSMEYGLAPALPIYSGGLGILAGDHLKSASDLGLPLVGVGLLYQEGYFHQYLTSDGWQQETYPKNLFYNLPVQPVKDDQNKQVSISLEFPGRQVIAQIWKTQVGRITLYLLDTNMPENTPEDQLLTNRLYDGDANKRIQQEILLGIGGIRTLRALGINPQICHMNEGHSAFMALERVKNLMEEKGLSFQQAREAIRGGNVFTSHTPVPAGIDEFEPDLIDIFLSETIETLGIDREHFLRLGGVHLPSTKGLFNMAIFAINMSGSYNGVSKLHGKVAREMWQYLWPDLPSHQVPIEHVTNGVHLRTWISEDMAELFNYYLGPRWHRNPATPSIWERINNIPEEELWRAHERRREQLVSFSRSRLQEQLKKSGANPSDVEAAAEVLNPKALTIGFARRFAQYKRAYLLFKDLERLKAILNHPDYPVQIIFAGKAHPKDTIGKEIIRDIISTLRHSEFRNKIVFLENYDMLIADYLLSGVDIWLNTPRRPREASGTSGMKAGSNGVLNVSILDGWWDEAYQNDIGWAIGRGEVYANTEEQDKVESESLYYLLEQEIIPLFYSRGSSNIPHKWISMMKNSIRTTCSYFNTNRMVQEYFEKFYHPALKRWNRLNSANMSETKTLVQWKDKVIKNWEKININQVEANTGDEIKVGNTFPVKAQLDIDGLSPQELSVQVYYGLLDNKGNIQEGSIIQMELETVENSIHHYKADIPCKRTGPHGFAIRVLPFHSNLTNPYEMGLIKWDNVALD